MREGQFKLNLLPFQINASTQIADRFISYMSEPLMVTKTRIVPFYQNLISITGSGKTAILADVIEQIRLRLPVEPVVLWLSKGKVVVWQTYSNLSIGKYSNLLYGYQVKPLHEATSIDLEDSSKGLILIATVGKFNQKDMEKGDRRIFQIDLDYADQSLWDLLKIRRNRVNQKRNLIIIYDEGHNLSNQQTKLLIDLEPDALIAASATMKIPSALSKVIDRLKTDKEWADKDFVTLVKSSDVVKSGLVKRNLLLGGYVTPMEVAIDEMLLDLEKVEKSSESLGLTIKPKAIYVTPTNIVGREQDNIHISFENRLARPIVIWKYLVSKGINPNEIAVYCNLKFDKKYPAPPEFILFSGGDADYDNFIEGNYRHIIFNLSLQEGWDDPECYFAYIDKDMGSKDQITQVVGRVLRQPGILHYPLNELNTAHFYIRTDQKQAFKELLDDVSLKITSELPDVTISFYEKVSEKTKRPLISPRKYRKLPEVAVDASEAKEPIRKIIAMIPDSREDKTNTVGPGGRIQVLQMIGSGKVSKEEWVDTEHSNRIMARLIFSRQIQKYYPKAINLCDIEEPKFDAMIEYNSIVAQNIRESAEKVVDAYIEYSTIVQNPASGFIVGEVPVDYANMYNFKTSLHEGYSGLNSLERKFAEALDDNKQIWFRNPSRGLFQIPLLDKGGTNTFNPDFVVWSQDGIFAIDTKGDHLITEDSARKLFFIKKIGTGPDLYVRLITEGEWDNNVKKIGPSGFTVWKLKLGKVVQFHAATVTDSVRICLQK